jgi:hypothetical protein
VRAEPFTGVAPFLVFSASEERFCAMANSKIARPEMPRSSHRHDGPIALARRLRRGASPSGGDSLRQTFERRPEENSVFTLRKTAASFVFKQPAFSGTAN